MKLTVKELAERLGCPFEGDGAVIITNVAGLEKAERGDLVFCAKPKWLVRLETTKASAAILPRGEKFDRIPVLRADDPHLAFVRATEIFHPPGRPEPGIHPTAVLASSARIGKGV